MHVFIAGGTGFVGRELTRLLTESGRGVTVLSRKEHHDDGPVQYVQGDVKEQGPWMDEAARADALVDLAGDSIFQRWNDAAKKRIRDSRVLSARNMAEAAGPGSNVQTFLCASAVGYYGFRGDEELTEQAAAGDDFLAQVCMDWEAEAFRARENGVRAAAMRFGIVLDRGGGALGQMLPWFKIGLGGRLGSGRQWFSWVHRRDLARAALFVLDHDGLSGPVNFTAPHPVQNRDLARALGRALHRPAILPAPGFALKLVLGEFGSVLLEGQRAVPAKLLEAGFSFEYPTLEAALQEALSGVLGFVGWEG